MIIDSSVLIAILRDEPDAERYANAIANAEARRISAAAYLEAAIVIDGSRDPIASRRLDDLMRAARITIEPVTEKQVHIARDAYRDFGKGSGHPANLNFGDCFSYALSKDLSESLLYKGNELASTDIGRSGGSNSARVVAE
ncbi:MAG TPA: type II toxin-antitoxin system VapC family toxin [Chthonomonadales bacterium]|nr:type II toxin-antitoxin system VapC family toxin [Chthonomonadales bacterium]